MIEMDKKLYAVFVGLEKTYDKVWSVSVMQAGV